MYNVWVQTYLYRSMYVEVRGQLCGTLSTFMWALGMKVQALGLWRPRLWPTEPSRQPRFPSWILLLLVNGWIELFSSEESRAARVLRETDALLIPADEFGFLFTFSCAFPYAPCLDLLPGEAEQWSALCAYIAVQGVPLAWKEKIRRRRLSKSDDSIVYNHGCLCVYKHMPVCVSWLIYCLN